MSSLNDDDKKYYMSMELKDLERILPYSGKASEYINTLIELKKMELYSQLPPAPTEIIKNIPQASINNIPREKINSIFRKIHREQLIKHGDPDIAKQETLPLFEYEIRMLMLSMRGRKTKKMRKSKSKSGKKSTEKRSRCKRSRGKRSTRKTRKTRKSRKTSKRSGSKTHKKK
jgi:hypothetical protein